MGFVVALAVAWATKAAVLEPFAVAALLQVYFKTTARQRPDPEWDAKLSSTRAGEFVGSAAAGRVAAP